MPYNKSTALKNQKDFLRSQAHCGYPNIEREAKKTLAEIERREKEQAEFDQRIKVFNAKCNAKREEEKLKQLQNKKAATKCKNNKNKKSKKRG